MSSCKMDLLRSRKIKNLLTRKAPNLPLRKVDTEWSTSFNHMKLLNNFCHANDK